MTLFLLSVHSARFEGLSHSLTSTQVTLSFWAEEMGNEVRQIANIRC